MKREYIVTILVDPELAREHSILDESEDVEDHIQNSMQMALDNSFLFKDAGIVIDRVEMMDEDPGPGRSVGNDVNWDDED